MKNTPLINLTCTLKKFAGKGGWTYADLPDLPVESHLPFGWIIVDGFVDEYELKKHKLMPKGDGKLFLPVNAAIRKKIGKQVGDDVRIRLWLTDLPTTLPAELIACFENEPRKVYQNFLKLSDRQRQTYLDWIYSAKTDVIKTERIVEMLEKVAEGRGFFTT